MWTCRRAHAARDPARRGRRALAAAALAAAVFAGAAGWLPATAAIVLPRPTLAAPPLFVDAAETAGLRFSHVSGASGQYYLAEEMGAGVALLDYDNDGDLDVFLVQGGSLDGPEVRPGVAGPSARRGAPAAAQGCRLFRNDLTIDAQGRRSLHFTDVTASAGIDVRTYGMGVATGDYDNDGYLDLLITAFGPETLLHNNGNGTFTDVTAQAGVSDPQWSTSAAFVDYDRDGHLDLFVANYLDFTVAGNKRCADPAGGRDYCGPRAYHPVRDRLYRNDGRGHFTDVSESAGITRADGAGLGVAIGDYNADGWPDIYVANDATPNQLWINRGNGTFEDQGLLSGAAVNAAGNPEGSMGIASGDYDRDGDEDLFVTNLTGEGAVLYANDGHGNFEDVRTRAGLGAPTGPFTGFGTDWIDYDNDGWLDLFVTNGAVNTMESQRGQPAPFRMPSQLFRNLGTGRFADLSASAGPALARLDVGRGAAFGDLDNDGDVDIVATTNNGPARLLLNQAAAGAHWLGVRVAQPGGNRFGAGAWIGLERAGQPTLWRRVRTDGSYLSASDIRVHFGLGSGPAAASGIVVRWPDGAQERWADVGADRTITLARGSGQAVAAGAARRGR